MNKIVEVLGKIMEFICKIFEYLFGKKVPPAPPTKEEATKEIENEANQAEADYSTLRDTYLKQQVSGFTAESSDTPPKTN